ncbi:MAG: hypothetical protein L6R41_004690 [Letrouitia leprolyta]|nr:MAG: hypothetical protein L6R41_004690 [Letrouitia leprolyta]
MAILPNSHPPPKPPQILVTSPGGRINDLTQQGIKPLPPIPFLFGVLDPLTRFYGPNGPIVRMLNEEEAAEQAQAMASHRAQGDPSYPPPSLRPGSASTELFRTRPHPLVPRSPYEDTTGPSVTTEENQRKRSHSSFLSSLQEAGDAGSIDDNKDTTYDPNSRPIRATKPPRGQPRARTRHHHYPGSTGISRSQRRRTSQFNAPIVQPSALRTSDPDAIATSHATSLPPNVPSCDERPDDWPVENIREYQHGVLGAIKHSPPLFPCANAEKHLNGPHYVCASCRVRGAKHREKYFTELTRHDKWFPICDHCATHGAKVITKPENIGEDGFLKKLGCECGTQWKCNDCALLELEEIKVSYEAEQFVRRRPVGVSVLDNKKCTWIGESCICGSPLQGNEPAWRCTNCKGIGYEL